MNLGSNAVSKLYMGGTEVPKAYLGSTVAYDAGGEPAPDVWTFFDPSSVCTREVTGGQNSMVLPDAANLNYWAGNKDCPRIRQAVSHGNFDVYIKIDTPRNQDGQGTCILIEESDTVAVMGNMHLDGATQKLQTAFINGGSATQTGLNQVAGGEFGYLRATYDGSIFRFYSSPDGAAWTLVDTVTAAITVTNISVAALSYANNGFTDLVDSFIVQDAGTTGVVSDDFSATAGPPASAPTLVGTFDPSDGVVNSAYSYNAALIFSGTVTSYSQQGTLPPGLTFNAATCVISGTPSADADYSGITVTAINTIGSTVSQTANIVIAPQSSGSVAVDDSYSTTGATPLVVAAPGILSNDTYTP